MMEPDFEKEHTHHGGELKDVPQPHVRRFPTATRKRVITVNVTTWKGMAVGASHFYVRIEAEPNPLWDSKEGFWRVAWGDKEAHDIEYSLRCATELAAWEFVKCVWDTYYNSDGYKLVTKHYREPIDLDKKIATLKGIRPS